MTYKFIEAPARDKLEREVNALAATGWALLSIAIPYQGRYLAVMEKIGGPS